MKNVIIMLAISNIFTSFGFSSMKPTPNLVNDRWFSAETLAKDNRTLDAFSRLKDLKCSPLKEIDCTGLFPVRAATTTQIGLLTNGEVSFAARLQSLQKAKKSIRIQALVLKGDESGRKIADILIKKKNEGLDVRVIVDAFSNLDLETQYLYYELKRAGIELEGYEAVYLQWMNEISFSDPYQPNKRFHDKMWIIDGEDIENRVAILGGMNIANEYFRVGITPEKIWRDQDFIVKGEVIGDIVKAFDRNFQDQKRIKSENLINTDITWEQWRKLWSQKSVIHPIKELNKIILNKIDVIEKDYSHIKIDMKPAKVQFIQNRPRYKETFIEQSYEKIFSTASKSIYVVNAYFIPSKEVINALKQAVRNGAIVKLITNSPETNDLPEMAIASRYLYKNLLSVNDEPNIKGKMEIYEWVGHKFSEGTIHAKFAVIDEKVVIGGSYNLDPRSANLNSETVLVFEQKELATELVNFIKSNDLTKSILITKEQAESFYLPNNILEKLKLVIWNFLSPQL